MADVWGTLRTQLKAISGISSLMPECYQNEAPATVLPPYGEITDQIEDALLDMAVFDGPQVDGYRCNLVFWAPSRDTCRAWAELVKQYLSDWGTVSVAGYGSIPGVERGRISYEEDRPRNRQCDLMQKVTIPIHFHVEYTAALG